MTHAAYILKRNFNEDFLKEQTWTSLVANRPNIEEWLTFPFKGKKDNKENFDKVGSRPYICFFNHSKDSERLRAKRRMFKALAGVIDAKTFQKLGAKPMILPHSSDEFKVIETYINNTTTNEKPKTCRLSDLMVSKGIC